MSRRFLEELCRRPGLLFTPAEVEAAGADLTLLTARGVLRSLPIGERVGMRFVKGRHLLVVRDEAGAFEGFDPEDADEPPVPLQDDDVILWEVDPVKLGDVAREHYELSGRAELLTEGLIYVGSRAAIGVVLVLMPATRLLGVSGQAAELLPAEYQRVVLLTPLQVSNAVKRADAGKCTWAVVRNDNWETDPGIEVLLDMQMQTAGRRAIQRPIPKVVLNEGEHRDFEQYLFNSRLVLDIPGHRVSRGSNEVLLDGVPVIIRDSEFIILLVLVLALINEPSGYVPLGRLREGGGLSALPGIPPISEARIRDLSSKFRPALGGLEHTQFVEINKRRVRLSTHPRYVYIDREQLLRHKNRYVRYLARLLPADFQRVL